MPSWEIRGCTVADAAELARNNMSAFWEDPTWILLWLEHVTKEFLIEQATKRYPRSLLRDRTLNRHQKAVDPATGTLVGYARWVLPEVLECDGSGRPTWPQAQVPAVTADEEEELRRLAESAWWEELDYLAVHPNNKGKGIGTALVEAGMGYAEKARLPIFAMAFKAGFGIYRRLGFKEDERVIQDDSQFGGKGEYGAYFMIYDVKSG
ncbi:acyl-CoA N-acyltransferase [Coniochaeta sp. 2T2.1]|nr:acyl-CoA N-acyltransferase [Coniochaeta sp. 2T2.1]